MRMLPDHVPASRIATSLSPLVAVLCLIMIAAPAHSAVPIQFTAVPTPASNLPGSQGSVLVTITNRGSEFLQSLTLSVDPTGPGLDFNATKVTLGNLSPNSTKSAQFPYHVPAAAKPGFYSLRATIEGFTATNNGLFDVAYATIVVRSPTALTISSFTPNRLQPGERDNATVTFANLGSGRLSNIDATWSSPADSILPLEGSNNLQVAALAPGQNKTVTFPVAANPNAPRGLRSLNFKLLYNDDAGTRLNASFTVGIFVGGPTTFEVGIQNVTGDTVSLLIANVGLDSASSVVVRPTDAAVLTGGPLFLHEVGSGEARPARLHLAANGLPNPIPAGATARFDIDYTDPLGVRHTAQVTAPWVGHASQKALSANLQSIDGSTVTVAVTNVGFESLSAVQIRLLPGADYSLTGADTVTLGNLKPGEFLTADFEVHHSGHGTPATGSALVSYTDSLGARRTEQIDLQLASVTARAGLSGWAIAGIIVAALAVVAVGIGVAADRRRKAETKARAERERAKGAGENWPRRGPE